uniref:Uncharacterized protein n=1 Tax=Arion vulgaris TaxID=1028688 RepID=A0A0B6ZJK4_9EUPU
MLQSYRVCVIGQHSLQVVAISMDNDRTKWETSCNKVNPVPLKTFILTVTALRLAQPQMVTRETMQSKGS